ncbi:MAK10-like protein [Tanacetum coccineum]
MEHGMPRLDWLIQTERSLPNYNLLFYTSWLSGNREVQRTRLRSFQFYLRDQASNWLERLPAGSITTWEDLTIRFLAQFFPPERTAKLRNDILMQTIDQSAGGKLHDKNAKESWALLDDLALYNNESWNDPRDFAQPVKAISLPQDVPSTSDRRLIELENQVQRLMEAHLAPMQPTQMNKITSSCEIGSGPHDTQYCMENLKQAFVEYASSRTDEARDAILSKFEADFKQQQSEMTNKIDTVLKSITDRIAGALPNDTVKNSKLNQPNKPQNDESKVEDREGWSNPENINTTPSSPHDPSISIITEKVRKLNSFLESSDLVPQSSDTKIVCTKGDDGDVIFIEIIRKNDDSRKEGPEDEGSATIVGLEVEYFDTFLTRSELAYHMYLMSGPIPSLFLRNPIIIEGCPSNLKIPCNIRHVHVEKAYIDHNFPLNVMTRMLYNWIMRRKLNPREVTNRGVSNFTRRIKRMHVFVGNFTYVLDFMIVEDISSIIDPRLSQVVLGKPFVEISNMTHDLLEGVVCHTPKIKTAAKR